MYLAEDACVVGTLAYGSCWTAFAGAPAANASCAAGRAAGSSGRGRCHAWWLCSQDGTGRRNTAAACAPLPSAAAADPVHMSSLLHLQAAVKDALPPVKHHEAARSMLTPDSLHQAREWTKAWRLGMLACGAVAWHPTA